MNGNRVAHLAVETGKFSDTLSECHFTTASVNFDGALLDVEQKCHLELMPVLIAKGASTLYTCHFSKYLQTSIETIDYHEPRPIEIAPNTQATRFTFCKSQQWQSAKASKMTRISLSDEEWLDSKGGGAENTLNHKRNWY